MSAEIFGDQASVAVVRFVLTAQQARAFDGCGIDPFFDFAFLHQVQERGFIDIPVALVFFVGIEDVLGGGEQRQVDVVDADNLLEEILEVVAL